MVRPRLLIVGSLAAVILLGWFLWWRSAGVQIPAVFDRLSRAIAGGNASGVLSTVHQDYDFPALWPSLFSEEVGGEPRAFALRGLLGVFLIHREDRLHLSVDLQSQRELPDGRVESVVTLVLTSTSGNLPFQLGEIHRHRFWCQRQGWIGRFAISGHDPIAFSR